MTEESREEAPRSWLPFAIAVAAAVLVIAIAIVTTELRSRLGPEKQAAVAACEQTYDDTATASSPRFIGGDIFAVREWRDLDATLVRLGYMDQSATELTGEQESARDDEADALVAKGDERVTVIWQMDDESHVECVANLTDGTVVGTPVITPLGETATSPSPSPSP